MATPIGSIRVVQKKGPFLHHAYNHLTICLTSNGDDMSYTWGSLDSFVFSSDLSWVIFLLKPWLCLSLVLMFIFLVHSDACFMLSAMSCWYWVHSCLLTCEITTDISIATLDTHTLTPIVVFVGNLLGVLCVVYVFYFPGESQGLCLMQ